MSELVEEPLGPQTPLAAPSDGSHAAAVLLMLIGDAEAAEILGRLDAHEVQRLGSAMFHVSDVSEQDVARVIDRFAGQARSRTTIGFGATPRIRAVMHHALGTERAEAMLAKVTPPQRCTALDSLRWMDARTIAALIATENRQVAALVLSHLEPPIAADVLQLLPDAMQADVLERLASLEPVSSDALDALEATLVARLQAQSASPGPARGGAMEAAKIVNALRPDTAKRLIKDLARTDRSLARRIEDEMFVFEDLARLDDRNLGLLMRELGTPVLVKALKGAEPPLTERMLGCISRRAADTIRDEMADLGLMRRAEVTDAQREIVGVARTLIERGVVVMTGRGDDYV